MSKQNIKSFYAKIPDSCPKTTKNEVLNGLSSKDIKEKEKHFKILIVNILNNPYFDQLIMSVLNFIVPYQNQSIKLKKMLIVYWEII
jgi:vesicle coat complex subunit